MQAILTVSWGNNPDGTTMVLTDVDPLEVADMVARRHGFYELDLDNDDKGIILTATSDNRTVTARGKNVAKAVEGLLDSLATELS